MAEDQDTRALSDEEIEAEVAAFAEAEARRLGLGRQHYTEAVHTKFTGAQRAHTTLLVSGLSMAHDILACAAMRGMGYHVQPLDAPDNAALQFGKEFGNRGQCNPTYFTVGNLVKHLVWLRDEQGLSTAEIVENYVFLSAGACGPCRFGMYVTEYRKALRDAGFDGFRVLLIQQQAGVKQATGEAKGLEINASFSVGLVSALLAGDVLNLIGYRLRPYEVTEGAVDAALGECKQILISALEQRKSLVVALVKCRRVLGRVPVDRTVPKPVVSIIGEFWAMTTEGDGNYHLQRFLEGEGAEVDIQPLVNWLLFMVWENRFDTLQRLELREEDGGRKGLEGKDSQKKLLGLMVGDKAIRGIFQMFAKAIGLHGYHLPDMDQIAELSKAHYDNFVRGGEAHMEVGKLVHFVEDRVNHMTISVKPFGCMPSSGVSDGVQGKVQAKYPEALFLPIETTGDGAVNVQSRVQMVLFKARQKAKAEYEEALRETGLSEEEFKRRVTGSRRWGSGFYRPRHRVAGGAANLVFAVG